MHPWVVIGEHLPACSTFMYEAGTCGVYCVQCTLIPRVGRYFGNVDNDEDN